MQLDPKNREEWALYTAVANAWATCNWDTEVYRYISEAKMLTDGIDPDTAKREGHWPPYRPPRRRFAFLRRR